jgi:Flp pilus assembly pilin Flp
MLQKMQDCWLLASVRLHQLLTHERAQTLAEYGLIMSLVAVGVVLPTLLIFRGEMAAAFNSATNCLDGTC